jgi:hypothetical protein
MFAQCKHVCIFVSIIYQKYINNLSIKQYTIIMNGKALKKLRLKLPRGYVERLVNDTGISSATIMRVMKGDSSNQVVIDAAIKLATEYQESINTQQEQINSL